MQEKGLERASRLADRIQLFALVVVLLIISTAVWLASYFLIQPFVQDTLVQMLIATAVSLALAGLILVWRKRVIPGAFLFFISAGIIALSLALFWQSFQGYVLSLHGFLLASLAILNSLRNREKITNEAYQRSGWVLGSIIIITGPLGIAIGLLAITSAYSFILAGFTFSLAVYVIGVQYMQKSSRLGVPNVIIISIAPTMLTVDFLINSAILSPVLLISGFFIAFGTTLFIASQCAKRLQSWVGTRWVRKSQEKKGRDSLFEEIGLGEVVEDEEEPLLIPDEWIIVPEDANTLSGISLILVAVGVPTIFLWLSESTIWGTELQLMGPIAFIIGLLILAPSPVFFRLGERLTRDSEYAAVRAIGVAIVLLASASGFFWTQFYLWPILISFSISVVLFAAGITGLFRQVRKLWRQFWLSIVGRLRELKSWVLSNMLITGVVGDLTLCIILYGFINPILQVQPGYPLSVLGILAAVFSGVGILGLSFFRAHPRRLRFLSIGVMLLLSSLVLVTFWQFYDIMLFAVLDSIAYSLLWFLGSIALFKFGISRLKIGLAYLPGFLAAVYLTWMLEAPLPTYQFPILTVLLIITLPGPILHIEYRKAGGALLYGARRLGTSLYNALIYLGRVLLKFILISWALIVVAVLTFVAWQWLAPYYSWNLLPILGWITLAFFLAYIPAIGRAEESPSYLMQVCILGIALALGVLVFFYTQLLHTLLRVLASALVTWLVLTIAKNKFPEEAQVFFFPTAWIMTLSLVCSWIFLTATGNMGEIQSGLLAMVIFGLGLLPLKLMGAPPRVVNTLYTALAVPSAVLLTYLVFADYLLTLTALFLAPIPVAYKQYGKVISAVGNAALIALRVFFAYIAIYLIIAVALFSLLPAALLVYYLLPLFSFHSLPVAPIVITFILLWMCLWLPALYLRRSENLRLHSVVLIILCAAVSLDLVVLLQISDPILTILTAVTLFSVLFTIVTPVLVFIEQRARSAAFAISVILLLGLYLAPFDLIPKILLAIFGIGLIATPVLSKANRVLIAYPVVTCSLLAFLFWYFDLHTLDARLVAVGYVAIESMLLSVPEQLRNKVTWTVFAVSTGLSLALVLSPFMTINLVLASLVALEILRFTPGFKIGEKTGMLLGVARALLVGATVYLLIISWIPLSSPLRHPLMEFGLSSLITTAILAFSMRRFISSERLIGLQSLAVLNFCIVIFFYLWIIVGVDFLYSAYIAGIPLLVFAGVLSTGDTFKRAGWVMFCIVITAMISGSWFTYYRSIESLWLCITTAIFLTSSLRLTDPKGHEDIAGKTNVAIGTLILMLETIWVWHCFLVFLYEMNVVLAGVGVLLTPVLLMPLRSAISWDAFRILWGVVSTTIAVSLGSLISGWNLYDLILPTEPYLTFGIILSLFSFLSTPAYLWIESRLRIDEERLTARYSWSPSLAGWAALGLQVGTYLLGETRFMYAMGGLGFALALLIFYFLTPSRPRTLFVANILILASAIAVGVWVWAEPNLGTAELIALFLFVWYILSLPLTLAATMAFLGWLATKWHQLTTAFSRFISWARAGLASALQRAKEIYSRNKATFATLLPILIGGLVFLWMYDPMDASTILGLPYKNPAFAITLGLALVGLIYWFEAVALEPKIGNELRSPSMILFGFGVNNIILLMSLTAASYELLELIFILSFAASLALIALLAQASSFSLKVWMRRIAGTLGITLFITTYRGLITNAGFLPIQALLYAVIIFLLVEIPVFWVQVKAFVALLGRYGAIIIKAIKNLGSLLLTIFRRFGYVMWTFFTLLFVVVIAVLSRPLFSELLNMPTDGLLYEVPGFSVPTAIIGLLMLFIAIVRRRVRTRFGLFSGLYAAFGGGVTVIAFLFDHGHQVLSLFSAIIAICGTGLMLKGELQLDPRRISMLWSPIPPSISLSLLYYMPPASSAPDSFLLALLISFSSTFMLYLLSTTVNWIPKRYRELLWSILAIMTGSITYFSSYLLIVPPFEQVAGIYLGVFVASIIMYPVTARSARQLFLSPLFFALTGFAYTIVLGPVYQSLLLAAAAFLFFVSRYIKEKETMNPRLVYLRLVVLVALVTCIAVFAIVTGLEIISAI
ncbi:MAG: hypothetical protein AM325_013565 [Candidatus Thorarchaeota archaeon SMTZ1-45]